MPDNPASAMERTLEVIWRHPVKVLGGFLIVGIILMVIYRFAIDPGANYAGNKIKSVTKKAKDGLTTQGTTPTAADATTRGI